MQEVEIAKFREKDEFASVKSIDRIDIRIDLIEQMTAKENKANTVFQSQTKINQLTADKSSLNEQFTNEQKMSSSLRLSLEDLNSELATQHAEAQKQTLLYDSMISALQHDISRLTKDSAATLEAKTKVVSENETLITTIQEILFEKTIQHENVE